MTKFCLWGISLAVILGLIGLWGVSPRAPASVSDDEAAQVVGGTPLTSCECFSLINCVSPVTVCTGTCYAIFPPGKCQIPNQVANKYMACGPATNCSVLYTALSPCILTPPPPAGP